MRTFLLLLAISTILFSCKENNEVSVKINISDPTIPKVLITNAVDMFYDTIDLAERKEITLNLDVSPSVFLLRTANIFTYFYAKGGDEVIISKAPDFQEFIVGGSSAKEQELLLEFNKALGIANTKHGLNALAGLEEGAFLDALEQKYQAPNAILAAFASQNADKALIAILEGRLEADRASTMINYPQYYNYFKKKKPVLSENFFRKVDAFDFENKDFFYFDDVVSNANSIIGRKFDYADYETLAPYFAEIYNNVDNLVKNEKVAELLKFKVLSDKIALSGGTAGMIDEIKGFIETSVDPHRKQVMQYEVDKWAHLQEGMPAPEFTAYTRDGEEVKLSDLRGKNVYIDVWATWCGPCIREIPSLKMMEEKYHKENVSFVSVSIDEEKDKEKWMKFVEDRELGGIQIMSKNDWRSELSQNYNISGIPRFIMVDSEGKLVSADAPRPSSTNAFNKMIESVIN